MRSEGNPRWRSIGARTCLVVAALAALAAACNSLLAIKDPTLEDAGGEAKDAATDAAIDASIDAAVDAPIDAPPPKLWVFVTDASFRGNFGVAAPGARGTADIKCQDMYNANFIPRGCDVANVHAVIQVDNTDDTLARMELRFPIPQTSEVLRATDAMRVTGSWDDLVDPNKILTDNPITQPTTTVTTMPFWSGRGLSTSAQCTGWTTTAGQGDAGDTTLVNKWTSTGGTSCDMFLHLLCVCW